MPYEPQHSFNVQGITAIPVPKRDMDGEKLDKPFLLDVVTLPLDEVLRSSHGNKGINCSDFLSICGYTMTFFVRLRGSQAELWGAVVH